MSDENNSKSEMGAKHQIPDGATHFVKGNDEERDHFIEVDEVGNVLRIYCPDYPCIGWDSDIDPFPMPIRAIPVSALQENEELRGRLKAMGEILKGIEAGSEGFTKVQEKAMLTVLKSYLPSN